MISHKRLLKNSAIETPITSYDVLVLERLSFFAISHVAILNIAAAIVITNILYLRSYRVTSRYINKSASRE
jgi:hypothetical protein